MVSGYMVTGSSDTLTLIRFLDTWLRAAQIHLHLYGFWLHGYGQLRYTYIDTVSGYMVTGSSDTLTSIRFLVTWLRAAQIHLH